MDGQLILPFYVLADVSYSMTQPGPDGGQSPLDALNEVVINLKVALEENPILSDKIRFALVDFSDDAQTQIPLCDLLTVDNSQIPTLTARGGTSFAAAFAAIQQQIDSDVRQMKADGNNVHRPVVFFLTDGEPTDPDGHWQQAFADLTSDQFRARPNFIPFGVADAPKAILDQLAFPPNKMRSFKTKEGANAADAIRSMAEILISSVIASANSISADGQSGGFVLPDEDEEGDWL